MAAYMLHYKLKEPSVRVCLHDNDVLKMERFFLCVFHVKTTMFNTIHSHESMKMTLNSVL